MKKLGARQLASGETEFYDERSLCDATCEWRLVRA